MSDTMDKQYDTRKITNMRARKRKMYLPPKLHIHPTINSKWSKVLHANAMVQTMGNNHLDLRDYARLHLTIHCKLNQNDNVMRNPMVTTIPTQYHVSKGLKVFCDPGVAAVLKEQKQLHDRMVMEPKNADKTTTSKKKGRTPISNVFEAKDMRKNKGKRMCRLQKTS